MGCGYGESFGAADGKHQCISFMPKAGWAHLGRFFRSSHTCLNLHMAMRVCFVAPGVAAIRDQRTSFWFRMMQSRVRTKRRPRRMRSVQRGASWAAAAVQGRASKRPTMGRPLYCHILELTVALGLVKFHLEWCIQEAVCGSFAFWGRRFSFWRLLAAFATFSGYFCGLLA